MKTHLKTAWRITIYILIHFAVMTLYLIGAGVFYGLKMGMNGLVEEIEAGIEIFMELQTSISVIIAAIGAFLIYRYMMKRKGLSLYVECRFKKLGKKQAAASVLIGAALIFLGDLIFTLSGQAFPQSLESHIDHMEPLLSVHPALLIISIGIAAPLIEEILFRGLVFKELEQKSTIATTIILQAVLFGVYHLNLVHGIFTAVMGLFLGLALYWTGSIWAPILIHLTTNLLSTAMSLLGFGPYTEAYPLVYTALYIVAVWVVIPLSMRYLYRHRNPWESQQSNDNIATDESQVSIPTP